MRISVDFDRVANELLDGSLGKDALSARGLCFKKGQSWANVERALASSAEQATLEREDHVFWLGERLRKVFHLSLALTPTVVREEAIVLKDALRHTQRNTKQFRALERRVQLLAQEIPYDTENHDYRVAMLALDTVATRENLTIAFKEVA